MDKLLTCAMAFKSLLDIKYHIIIGRKRNAVDLTVSFEAGEFHHLVGLHKLHDLRLARANREKVFYGILSGDITLDDIKKSRCFCNIQKRLEPFSKIESLFDQNDLGTNIPMSIFFLTKKTNRVLSSAVLFSLRKIKTTQKVKLFILF